MVSDGGIEAWNWFVEACCKLYLWFIGSVILTMSLVVWFGDSSVRSRFLTDWLWVYILWVGTFAFVTYQYLWGTEGGMRLLVRILNVRTPPAKTR